jgi:hypothetical protein
MLLFETGLRFLMFLSPFPLIGFSSLRWLVSMGLCGIMLSGFLPGAGTAAGEISFARDIQPVLAKNCFACHGPDEEDRQADLRLDDRAAAIEMKAIVPGRPDQSELLRRINAADPGELMPPPDSHKTLTEQEKQNLRGWIESGAEYTVHYAFVPPRKSPLPEVSDSGWCRTPIDRFILARLDQAGLAPSAEADRDTLIRRVSLDLLGLPPSPEEADDFARDESPLAYERLVDRLLASPAYGERWGRLWLDLARYADTNGYEKDRPRSVWPYRDWVIAALNADMPFDQFSIEQLAGDMLPNATQAQRIATGFHRNTMLNEEGGIDPLEFRYYAMVDRVATTGNVWLGLTTGCAQCHTHKYDPITHAEYYQLMALLDNADEPDLIVRDAEITRKRQQIEAQIAQLEARLPLQFPPAGGDGPTNEARRKNLETHFAAWLAASRSTATKWTRLRPSTMTTNLPRLELLEDGSIFSTGDITKRDVFTLRFPLDQMDGPVTAIRLEALPDDRLPGRGPGRSFYEGRKGDFFLSEVTANANGRPVKFASASSDYGKISIGSGTADPKNVFDGNGASGWSVAQREGEPHQLVLMLAEPVATSGELEIELLFERHFAASLGRFRLSATSRAGEVTAQQVPVEIEDLLVRQPETLSDAEESELMKQFLRLAPELAEARKKIDQIRQTLPDYPTTLIFQERPADNPRQTHRHHRGEYLSCREEVSPAVPAVFPPLPADQPANRLTFARWLVSKRNPLVGRVAVNRAWQAFFGQGLVRTSGDYGTQSEPPSHPELLDWLACEFVDQGWSLKKLHRLIVTSSVYRQSSRITPKLLKDDPTNQLLARGPRYRMDSELIRDLLLQASGLLSSKMNGPSVYPPQPESVVSLAYGSPKWNPSAGEDRYRRSIYTFSKRTAPFAAYAVFDAPSGENCIDRRNRSNTPLQALTLLNDEMFLEMAHALARQAIQWSDPSAESRATFLFRRILTRPPSPPELAAIVDYYARQQKRFADGELVPRTGGGSGSPESEFSAWVLTARALMNLDETITQQ